MLSEAYIQCAGLNRSSSSSAGVCTPPTLSYVNDNLLMGIIFNVEYVSQESYCAHISMSSNRRKL